MYGRVGGVQNRMQQTQVVVLFPGLFVPPNRILLCSFGLSLLLLQAIVFSAKLT
jgi:hypothetical protein